MIYNPNQTQAVAIEVAQSSIEASKNCIYDYVKVFNGKLTSVANEMQKNKNNIVARKERRFYCYSVIPVHIFVKLYMHTCIVEFPRKKYTIFF